MSARYVFLGTEGFPPTVYDAQVGDLLRVLDRHGLRFDVLNLDPVLPRTLGTRAGRARLRRLRQAVPGELVVRPYVPFEDRLGAPLATLQVAAHLLRGPPAVVHARGLWAAHVACFVRRRAPQRVRVVYDVRGDYEAEHAFHVAGRGDARDERTAPGLVRIRRAEGVACREADRLLCVSEALARALDRRHPGAAAKATVVPCGHDPEKFRLDPDARARWRAKLGLEGRWVLCYAGSLVPYQLPERVAHLGALARALRPDAHLLLVTPDLERARALLATHGLGPEAATALAAAHEDMPGLLAAADAGVLLRRRDPVNAVASPTKLAEYLACGLRLVVSEGIGDVGALVADLAGARGASGLGLVADPDDDDALRAALARAAAPDGPTREELARFARDRLARDRFVPAYLALYGGLARELEPPAAAG